MSVRWQAAATGATIAGIVAVASCRQVAGIGDPAPPLACHAPAAATRGCSDCLLDRCCDAVSACNGDPACQRLADCRATCADDACRADCEKKDALDDVAAAFLACEAASCDGACDLRCGGAGPPIEGCQPCAAACCDEGRAFRGDVDGQRLRACRASCKPADAACVEGCAELHARGADLEDTSAKCAERACNVEGDFSCVGHVEPRRLVGGPVTLTLHAFITDYDTRAPLTNATVKACRAEDLSCANAPFGTSVSDAGGRATLKVTLDPRNGADAYPGFVEIDHDDYLPMLIFFAPPLVADFSFEVAFISNATAMRNEQATGTVLMPDRGHFFFTTYDCSLRPAVGVSVRVDSADATSRSFYGRNASAGGAYFDFDATSTSDAHTGGIVNLPPGPTTFTARVDALCLDLAKGTVGVRAGAISEVLIPPLP